LWIARGWSGLAKLVPTPLASPPRPGTPHIQVVGGNQFRGDLMGYESMYLVNAELKESIWGIAICIFIGLLGILFKSDNVNELTTQIGRGKRTRFDDYLVTSLFFSMALIIFYIDSMKWISLRNNYSETKGMTTGKSRNRIKYSYTVKAQEYSGSSAKTYFFINNFPQIEEHDREYVVIYDSTDPTVSLMDFNRRVGN